MTSKDVSELLQEQWEIFEKNNERYQRTKIKAACSRARKSLLKIKELAIDYRNISLTELKNAK